MEKKTWDRILKKIAKEKGFSDWSEYVFLTDKPTSEMYEEAAQRYADQEKKAYAKEIANDALINAALRLERSELCHKGDWQFIELEIIDPANIHIK